MQDKPALSRPPLSRIASPDDVAAGLDALCAADERLRAVRAAAGAVPLRLSAPGLRSLVSIIVSQQVSRASADAIFGRLERLADPLTAEALLAADEGLFRAAGLSRPKQRTLLALGRAMTEDGLDLAGLCELPPADAMRRLTAVSGIGAWTAEVYLLFAAGHPDIFPARDVALQAAVSHALGHAARLDERAVARIAESWAPWRGVAARLFWAYYRTLRGRDAAPPAQGAENT